MPLDPTVVDAVANENFKVTAGTPAQLGNRAQENLINFQQRMQTINADSQAVHSSASGLLGKRIAEVDLPESQALSQLVRSSGGSEGVSASLAAAIAQILTKSAQSTP
jgi:hypothetical protein